MTRLISLVLAALLFFPPAVASASEGGGEHGAAAEGEKDVPAGPQFVDVGPITVPILRDGRIYQYVRVTVKLEAKDAADAKQITDRMPSLNDAYLSSLYGAFYNSRDMDGTLINLERLKARLANANSKVLPPNLVQNILIQQVSQNAR